MDLIVFVCLYISGMLMVGTPEHMAPLQNVASIEADGNRITLNRLAQGGVDVTITLDGAMPLHQFLIECEEQAVNRIGFD